LLRREEHPPRNDIKDFCFSNSINSLSKNRHSTHHDEQGALWINMNEETLIAITGIAMVILFFLPFFALPVIVYKLYLRFRAKKERARLEAQALSKQQEPSGIHEQTSPRKPVATLILMTLLVVVGGFIVGFGVGVFSHLIYIVFLFPFVMGINSGKMIVDAIRRAKVRKTSQLVFLSVLSAVVIYGAFHYTRYLGFQVTASMEIFSGLDEGSQTGNLQVTNAFLDYALKEETGHSGFLGYMLYEAKQGISIGRLSRSSSTNLGPALTWLYWLLEFGVILGLTIQQGKKVMARSFCEACGNWYGSEKHLGGTASANEPVLLDLLQKKDFSGLGKLIEKNAEVPSLELYLHGCQVCGKSQSQLMVRRASQGAKGSLQFKDATQTTLQPNESVLLLNQLSFSGD
jgi:hypothetical protein